MTEIAPPDAAPDTDVARLTEALIACPSVTPASGLVFDCLAEMLVPLGFAVHRFIGGTEDEPRIERKRSAKALLAAAISLLPGISMWCRRARGGHRRPLRPNGAAPCSMGAARWT